ncbi:GNAT family N-acetyltransferase [Stenotrophomonas mori]|uniref:GNAT family N-acetyltransferase n=1 Tax=Stenotrophomonas mori TaxID=2871096 RepID=A0ABT0SDE5_9GAMM|nr:GNAT family N-acetyltransferase [Stenotrophomonas mori]MCL7713136.1 GNAT family N-acetyltransferase [Stenotrophomonas mori]
MRGKPEVRRLPPRLPYPELSSPRLRLREVRGAAAPALFAIHSDPRGMRYGSCPAWTEPAQAERTVADIQRQRRGLDRLVRAIADAHSDRLVGTSAAVATHLEQGRAGIGYSLHPHWPGHGLASEVLLRIPHALFEDMGTAPDRSRHRPAPPGLVPPGRKAGLRPRGRAARTLARQWRIRRHQAVWPAAR